MFTGAIDPRVGAMNAAYQQEQALPFDLISNPAQGMAEVFAVMANAMRSAQNQHEALIYAQAAVRVNPDLTDAQLMIGQIYEDLGQPELAVAAYARIPEGDVFEMAARMGQAQVLQTLDQGDAAIAELRDLTEENPQSFIASQVLAISCVKTASTRPRLQPILGRSN